MLSWSSTRRKTCSRTDWKSLMIRGKSARRARLNSEDMESDEKTRGAGASRGVQGVRIARLCQLRLSWTSIIGIRMASFKTRGTDWLISCPEGVGFGAQVDVHIVLSIATDVSC
jgi:hypothetical protein